MARESFTPSSGDREKLIELPGADDLPENVVVDLDDKDEENFTVLEEDDTPENDRGRPTSYEPENENDGKRRDPASRIQRLNFERETERRAREQAEREREAALEVARAAREEVADLRSRLARNNTALADNMLERNKQQLDNATARLTKAHEEGNASEMAAAQVEISRLTAEEMAIKTRAPAKPAESDARPAPAQQAQPAQQAAPTLAPQVAAWVGRNRWFGAPGNEDKTQLAMATHQRLTKQGIAANDPRYIEELDRTMKAVYPDHVVTTQVADNNGSERRRDARPNANAGGSRQPENDGNARTITLTRSELSIAKRLGVTPQAYAREKLRRAAKGDGA